MHRSIQAATPAKFIIVVLLMPHFLFAQTEWPASRIVVASESIPMLVQAITPALGEFPHSALNAPRTLANQASMRAYFTAMIDLAKDHEVTPGMLMRSLEFTFNIRHARVGDYLRGEDRGGAALTLPIIRDFELAIEKFGKPLPDRSQYESVPLPLPVLKADPPSPTLAEAAFPEKPNAKRAALKESRELERTNTRMARATIVEDLVAARMSRRHAQELIASWRDAQAIWAEIQERRQMLSAMAPISNVLATRLALLPDGENRLRQLIATSQRLPAIWVAKENPLETLYFINLQRLEQRLNSLKISEPILRWCLAPLRGDLTDDGGPAIWYQRLKTPEELKAVLRSGALPALPEDPIDLDLEKALIKDLARQLRRPAWALHEEDFKNTPLKGYLSRTGERGKLVPITLAPIYTRYATTPEAKSGISISASERIAEIHWSNEIAEEIAAKAEAERAVNARQREVLDRKWKRQHLKYAGQIQRNLSQLYAKAQSRWEAAQEKAAREEKRQAEKSAREQARPVRVKAPPVPKKIPEPRVRREPRPIENPIKPDPVAPPPPPDYSLTPEVLAAIPDSGAVTQPSPTEQAAIEKALQILENEASFEHSTAILSLIKLRERLSYRDLFRLVKRVSEGLSDTTTVDGVGIALQRSWDGLDDLLRLRLNNAFVKAASTGILDPARATAMRRPIYSALTPVEAGLIIPEDLPAQWQNLTKTERILWIRVASNHVRSAPPTQTLAAYHAVRKILGISPTVFSRTLAYNDNESTALSLQTFMTEEQLQIWVYSIQKSPTEVIDMEKIAGLARCHKDSFIIMNPPSTSIVNALYLANRFHVFFHNINAASSGEIKRLLVNYLDRQSEPAPTDVAEAETFISDYLARRPVLPQNDGALKAYFYEHGIPEFVHEVSDNERMLVVDLLARLARDAFVGTKPLVPEDYAAIHVQLPDRSAEMGYFYSAMERLNHLEGKGYSTPYFIRARYGLAPQLEPLLKLRTITEFGRARDLEAIPRGVPWLNLHHDLQLAFIRELEKAAGKPAFWVMSTEYQYLPLKALSRPGKPFTLRNYYLEWDAINIKKPRKSTPLFIAEAFGLAELNESLLHPAQTLTTAPALKEALHKKWLSQIPWEYICYGLMDQFLQEVAVLAVKTVAQLTVRDSENISIPSLSTENPETHEWVGPKLRGLFDRLGRMTIEELNKLAAWPDAIKPLLKRNASKRCQVAA